MELTLDEIRERARNSRDDDFYDKMYALRLAMSGDKQATDAILKGGGYQASGTFAGAGRGDDLPDYPDVFPPLGEQGIQNHLLISSRINIQGIVYSDPEFVWDTQDPVIRKMNSAWAQDVWYDIEADDVSYEIGMDVEAVGLGFAELGITDGRPDMLRIDPLDVLFDPLYRSRGQWRYFFVRKRLDIFEAMEKYEGVFTRKELEDQVVKDMSREFESSRLSNREPLRVLHEWTYWSKDQMVCFIGPIQGGLVASLDENLNWVKDRVGPNPFPVIPIACWIDSWSPGMKHPVGKTETTWRTATMLNAVEEYIRETLARGVPINAVSTYALRPNQIEEIAKARGIESISKLILLDTLDVQQAIKRIEAIGIPDGVFALRAILKQELNQATGVGDTQRGNPVPGTNTAYEIRDLTQNMGVQSRHTRKQFSKFLEEVFLKLRAMAAVHEATRRVLRFDDIFVDTNMFPIHPFLRIPLSLRVKETSLQYMSQDQMINRRLTQLQAVDLPGIQSNVVDARKVFADVYEVVGKGSPDDMLLPKQTPMNPALPGVTPGAGAAAVPGGDGNTPLPNVEIGAQ